MTGSRDRCCCWIGSRYKVGGSPDQPSGSTGIAAQTGILPCRFATAGVTSCAPTPGSMLDQISRFTLRQATSSKPAYSLCKYQCQLPEDKSKGQHGRASYEPPMPSMATAHTMMPMDKTPIVNSSNSVVPVLCIVLCAASSGAHLVPWASFIRSTRGSALGRTADGLPCSF